MLKAFTCNGFQKFCMLVLMQVCAFNCSCQDKRLTFLKSIRSVTEVRFMDDSLPLFIYQGKVFQIRSECLCRNTGEGNNARNVAAGNNDRNNGKGNNDRGAGGGNTQRDVAKGNEERQAGDGNNERNAGKGNNDRNSGQGSDKRNAGNGNDNRNAAKGNTGRNTGNGNNDRNAGKGNDEREQGKGNNSRYADKGLGYFTCSCDEQNSLVIDFVGLKMDKSVRIYFHHKFYKANQNAFKIRLL